MNRRTFLASLAATSLTPIVPNQIFASGGIVNPDACGFIVGEIPSEFLIRLESPALFEARRIGIDPISMVVNIFMHGHGTGRKTGLFAT